MAARLKRLEATVRRLRKRLLDERRTNAPLDGPGGSDDWRIHFEYEQQTKRLLR